MNDNCENALQSCYFQAHLIYFLALCLCLGQCSHMWSCKTKEQLKTFKTQRLLRWPIIARHPEAPGWLAPFVLDWLDWNYHVLELASCAVTKIASVKYAVISYTSAPPEYMFDGSFLMRNKQNDLHPFCPCLQPLCRVGELVRLSMTRGHKNMRQFGSCAYHEGC